MTTTTTTATGREFTLDVDPYNGHVSVTWDGGDAAHFGDSVDDGVAFVLAQVKVDLHKALARAPWVEVC